jgi:hypothetical protein
MRTVGKTAEYPSPDDPETQSSEACQEMEVAVVVVAAGVVRRRQQLRPSVVAGA